MFLFILLKDPSQKIKPKAIYSGLNVKEILTTFVSFVIYDVSMDPMSSVGPEEIIKALLYFIDDKSGRRRYCKPVSQFGSYEGIYYQCSSMKRKRRDDVSPPVQLPLNLFYSLFPIFQFKSNIIA